MRGAIAIACTPQGQSHACAHSRWPQGRYCDVLRGAGCRHAPLVLAGVKSLAGVQSRLSSFASLQIMEECGYDVPLERIHPVTSYLSGWTGVGNNTAQAGAPVRQPARAGSSMRALARPAQHSRHARARTEQPVCLLSSLACTSDTVHTWFPPTPAPYTCSAAIGISGSTQSIFAAEIDDSMAARSGGGGLEDHGEAIEVHPSWRGA